MKSAFDFSHTGSVSCVCLLWEGEYAGKIVANWSDNPAGCVCAATVVVFKGPLENMCRTTGRAGGYGYDKLSAAIYDALRRSHFIPGITAIDPVTNKSASDIVEVSPGTGNQRAAFEAAGYTYIEIT